jgi:hypothetical protein
MARISTEEPRFAVGFVQDLLACGAPANDCALGQARIGEGRFEAVILARQDDGCFMIGLSEPVSGHVYAVTGAEDDDSIIADWRALGLRLGLPLAVELADGSIERIAPEHSANPRRYGSTVARRRSRFAARRSGDPGSKQHRRSAQETGTGI